LRQDIDPDVLSSVGGLDPDVVEAACLAHDLGHPPFGHVAEIELDRQIKDVKHVADGFEGNAQSFRILTVLSVRYPTVPGLNLTRATLSATTKYPWSRGTAGKAAQKWGAYSSEQDEFEFSRRHLGSQQRGKQTLEATLMDWSDDVAYAVHDLEDFFRVSVIPLDRLITRPDERDRFLADYIAQHPDDDVSSQDLEAVFEELLSFVPIEPYEGTQFHRATLRSMTSTLVGRYISAVRLHDSGEVSIDQERSSEVKLLKHLTWHYVIESRALISQRFGHAQLVRGLFSILCDAASEKDQKIRSQSIKIIPDFHRQEIVDSSYDDGVIVRAVADTIASMTEAQAISLHSRLLGYSLGSALDPIVN
jgi:dGTPase